VADLGDLDGEEALAGDVGDRMPVQVVRAEEAIGHRTVHVDVEEGEADSVVSRMRVVDHLWGERHVFGPQPRLELVELRGVVAGLAGR
jgi:hypothetical protein